MHKVITELVDDIDGSTAEETVSFALDGVEYEIDLSTPNASNCARVWTNMSPRVAGSAGVPNVPLLRAVRARTGPTPEPSEHGPTLRV